jgi:hypothetical protein
MKLKKYAFLLLTLISFLTKCSQGPNDPDNSSSYWQESKGVMSILHKNYVAPVTLPVVLELRQKIHSTEHELLTAENERLNVEISRLNVRARRASEVNTATNTAHSHCQMGGRGCKEMMQKMSLIIEKQVNDLYDEENMEEYLSKKSSKTETKPSEISSKENSTTNSKDNSKTESINTSAEENPTKINKGFIAKISTILCPPLIVKGIDFVATTCGTQAFANWLGKTSPLFAGKEKFISHSMVIASAIITSIAAYKLYEAITSEDSHTEEDTQHYYS